jgi:4-hydroxybenzoate polyprenyltransferase
MVTDIRRATVREARDTSGPATFAFGMLLVIVGIAGVLALHPMAPSLLRLTVGTAVVSAAILGPRPARVTATGAGLTMLVLGIAGLAGVTQVGSTGVDLALSLVLGIALTAVGRR